MTQTASNVRPSDQNLRILQVGAGSMGTRRMRDLAGRTDVVLAVLDDRQDRRDNAQKQFGVTTTFTGFDDALTWQPDAMIISTPPDQHESYVELAIDSKLHHFCEENIWTYDYRKVERISLEHSLVSLTSCSYHFLPIVRELKRIVSDELGELHGYQMALSTYMPGWHPDEGGEFYARKRHTSAAREMVPFELVWLNWVFGPPVEISGSFMKAGTLQGDCEDTWCLHMNLKTAGLGQLLVGQASPADYRSGSAIGGHGWIHFDLFSGIITRNLPGIGIEDTRDMGGQVKHMEQAYKDEINTFIDLIQGRGAWPHSYRCSSLATASLAAAESSAVTGQREKVSAEIQPEHLPAGQKHILVRA